MKTMRVSRPLPSLGAALAISGLQFLSAVFPCASARANPTNFFDWENLQSDIPGVADRTDTNLVNPWGLAINPKADPKTGPFWVADNGTGVSTLYQPDGTPFPPPKPLVVTIPITSADTATPPATPHAAPTGIVFNPFADAFILKEDNKPAAFIFDGEDGSITAWNGGLTPITMAVIRKDNSSSGAVYKGLALAVRKNGGPTLYAANFNSGTVDVFDSTFTATTVPGNFTDPNPRPDLPKDAVGWAPFGIASIDNLIYVTFAAQNAAKHDDVKGPGAGFVDVFTTEGVLVARLITGGQLNSPWGLAKVPDDSHFGKFNDDVLLVGNFGDGQINAYHIRHGKFLAKLHHRKGQPLEFNGLWSLLFFHDDLYFTAGIVDEADGLFGVIHPTENERSDE
jgi:uncharacterized protein (TIGR03118 family)